MTVKTLKKLLQKAPGDAFVYMRQKKGLYHANIDMILTEYDHTDMTTCIILDSNFENCG